MSDAEQNVEALNDPKVYNGLSSPPWPMTLEDATWWSTKIVGEWNEQLPQLEEAAARGEDAPLVTFGFCPVRAIRDSTKEDQPFLGDLQLGRTQFEWEADEDERKRIIDANEALPPCDPAIIYTIGDWLRSSHHGQGIMSAVAKAVITQWAIPRMNARHFRPTTFEANAASAKVFTKLGFKHWRFVPHIAPIKARGEFPAEKRSINVWELKLDEERKRVE